MSEILDSGERTEFTAGAVRDLHGSKGRFDGGTKYFNIQNVVSITQKKEWPW